jgi:hypothetical protein
MRGHSPSKTDVNALLPAHPRLAYPRTEDVDARQFSREDGASRLLSGHDGVGMDYSGNSTPTWLVMRP